MSRARSSKRVRNFFPRKLKLLFFLAEPGRMGLVSAAFVHLHLHTSYSMLDGACRVDDVVQAIRDFGMPAAAITDHGVMYGVIDFYQKCRAAGIKPIIGCEMYLTPGSRFDRKGGQGRNYHLGLLARDETGYHNLCRLTTAAHLEGFYYKPRIDRNLLAEHSTGLIGLSGCLKGEIAAHLVAGEMDRAVRLAGEYGDILGQDNFYIEVQDNGLPEQRRFNQLAPELARRSGLPLVATNDVHYLKKEHAAAHEVLLCLQTQTVISDPKRMRYKTNEFYLKSREEMALLFKDLPRALDATLEIADRCNVELEFGRLHFPTFRAPDGSSQKDFLKRLCEEGIRKRYGIPAAERPANEREREIVERYKSELEVIDATGFVNYFLVVWDFVRFAHESGISVGPGRGSGGGSLVAYVLGITAIDPLEHGLIFERFLNPERVSPPDFDIDFCQARRGEVIEYVKNKHGRENVAQIITFGSLGAKTVIRDVGRVLEIPYAVCDRFSKMVPEDPKMTLSRALEMNPEFKSAYETDPDCRRILDFGFVLEGLYRNPGTHAAGVVIGEKPLRELIPLARDKDNEPVTQYTMEPLGELGLLKMDFLGLKTLTVIRETLELIKAGRGVEIDLDNLPEDDKATYELLNRGDTVGVFQLESSGMRDLIRRIGIGNIADLTAMIALYRPGPMNMLDDYVLRKSGRAAIKYDHPLLEPILKETYGVMLYQEQVQRAANVLAGYSLGDADVLRRAMGKKKADVMEQQRARFIEGAHNTNKIPERQAGRVFDTMAKFAGYGFNKAHSAGYAIIAYQTAYLKSNYPAEFMAALLSSEIGNFDKIPVFIAEAGEMDLAILPPDVNEGKVRFEPVEGGIRYGLAGIKNVGQGAAEAIVAERLRGGPYAGLLDLCSRVDNQLANKKVLESLVRCGAMDGFGMHRARLFEGIDFAMNRAARTLSDRRAGQGSLFDLMDGVEQSAETDELPEAERWSESRLLAGEKELLGVYLSGHPLTQYADLLQTYQLTSIGRLSESADKTVTRVGGIVSAVSKRLTKARRETMAIVQLEGLDGSVQVLVFPEAYQTCGEQLEQDAAVMVCGEVNTREEQPRIVAHEIYRLEDVPKFFARKVGLHVPTATAEGKLQRIKDLLRLHPGETPVVICLQFPSGEKVFVDTDASFRVLPDRRLIHQLEQEIGEEGVFVAVNPKPCRKTVSNGDRRRRDNGGWNGRRQGSAA